MSRVKYPQTELRLPRSRFIRGSFTTKTTTDHKNQPLPENKHHFWIALACEKHTPGAADAVNTVVGHAWQSYQAVAGSGSPVQPYTGVFAQLAMGLTAPAFALKIDDGDTDPRWAQKEGAKGCFIFNLSTTFNLNLFDGNNALLDASAFVHGDYVDAYIGTAINGEVGNTAGVFLNPLGIRWLETGPRINIGRDPSSMFGAPTGRGYVAPAATPGPMSGQVMGHQAPAPQIGAPQAAPMMPPAPPMPPQPPQQHQAPAETTEQWNIRHTGHAAPGYRWNPATGAWDVDAPQSAPTYAPVSAPGVQAPGGAGSPPGYVGGQGAPVYGQPAHGAPSVAHGQPMGTAYPSNVGNFQGGSYGSNPGVMTAGQPQTSNGPAPSTYAAPGTAYPSNAYGPGNPPPGVQQQNFAGGPPRIG